MRQYFVFWVEELVEELYFLHFLSVIDLCVVQQQAEVDCCQRQSLSGFQSFLPVPEGIVSDLSGLHLQIVKV